MACGFLLCDRGELGRLPLAGVGTALVSLEEGCDSPCGPTIDARIVDEWPGTGSLPSWRRGEVVLAGVTTSLGGMSICCRTGFVSVIGTGPASCFRLAAGVSGGVCAGVVGRGEASPEPAGMKRLCVVALPEGTY